MSKAKARSKKASTGRAAKKDLQVRGGKVVKGGSILSNVLRMMEDTNKGIIGNIRA